MNYDHREVNPGICLQAIREGRGFELFMALFGLLKQYVSPNPAKDIAGVGDALEMCREIASDKNQDDMYDWLMWMTTQLPEGLSLTFLEDADLTKQLATEALYIDEAEFKRREQEEQRERQQAILDYQKRISPEEIEQDRLGEELENLETQVATPEQEDLLSKAFDVYFRGKFDSNQLEELKKSLAQVSA